MKNFLLWLSAKITGHRYFDGGVAKGCFLWRCNSAGRHVFLSGNKPDDWTSAQEPDTIDAYRSADENNHLPEITVWAARKLCPLATF